MSLSQFYHILRQHFTSRGCVTFKIQTIFPLMSAKSCFFFQFTTRNWIPSLTRVRFLSDRDLVHPFLFKLYSRRVQLLTFFASQVTGEEKRFKATILKFCARIFFLLFSLLPFKDKDEPFFVISRSTSEYVSALKNEGRGEKIPNSIFFGWGVRVFFLLSVSFSFILCPVAKEGENEMSSVKGGGRKRGNEGPLETRERERKEKERSNTPLFSQERERKREREREKE